MPQRECRLREEREFHDRQAEQRRLDWNEETEKRDEAFFLDHAPWIRRGLELLSPVNGLIVLDMGCGHARAGVELGRRGARVFASDLSLGYCREASERLNRANLDRQVFQADAERLPLATHSVDRIWGNAILHHLDPKTALDEVDRILKPGGRAVFCEPWGGNPLGAWVRNRVSYPGKERTRDESPWTQKELQPWLSRFPGAQVESFELFSALRRLWGTGARWKGAERLDGALLKLIPGLGNWCRYRLLFLEKKQQA